MLPAAARLTRRADFASTVRRGRRATGRTLVVHLAQGAGDTRAGFIVNRGVGGSVLRHRVQRRLRHLVRDRLDRVPPGSLLVVRALPAAAAASSAELSRDLDSALSRVLSAGRGR